MSSEKKPTSSGNEDADASPKSRQVRASSIMNSRSGLGNNNNNNTFDNQQDKILEQLISLTVQLRSTLGPSTEKILPLRTPLAALLDDLRVMQQSRRSSRMGCTPRAAIIGKAGSGKTTMLNFLLNRDAPIIDTAASERVSPPSRRQGKGTGFDLDNSLLGTGDFGENQSADHVTPLASSLEPVVMTNKEGAGSPTPIHTPSSASRRVENTNAQVHRFLNSLAAVGAADASPTSSISLSVTPVTADGQGVFPSAPSNQPVVMSSFGSPNAASAPQPPQRYSDSVARRPGSSPESLVMRSPGQRGIALRSAFIGEDRRMSFSRLRRKSVTVSGGMFDTSIITRIRASSEVAQHFPELRTAYMPPSGESIVPVSVVQTQSGRASSAAPLDSDDTSTMVGGAEMGTVLPETLNGVAGEKTADFAEHSHSADVHAVLGLNVSPPEPSLLEVTKDGIGATSDSDANTLDVSVSTQSSWATSEVPAKATNAPSWAVQEMDECVIRWESVSGVQVPLTSLADAFFLCIPSLDIEANALPASLSHLFPPLANKPLPPRRKSVHDSVSNSGGSSGTVLARWPTSTSTQLASEAGTSTVLTSDRGQALRQALVTQTFFVITFTDCVRDGGVSGGGDSLGETARTGLPSLATLQEMTNSFVNLMSTCYGVRVHASQVISFSGLYSRITRDLLTSFLQAAQSRSAEPKDLPRPPSSSSQGQPSSILKRRVMSAPEPPTDASPQEKDSKRATSCPRSKEASTWITTAENTAGSPTVTSPPKDTAASAALVVLPPRPPQSSLNNNSSFTGAGAPPPYFVSPMGQSLGSLHLPNYRRETFSSRAAGAGTGRLGPGLADALHSYCELLGDPELTYRRTEQDPLEGNAEVVEKAVGRAMSDTWYCSGCSQLLRVMQQFECYSFSYILSQSALSLMLWCAQLLPLFPKAAAVSAARVKRAEERLTTLRYKQAKVHESISRLQLVTPYERVKAMQYRMQCAFSVLAENYMRDLRRIIVLQEEPRHVDVHANEQLGTAFKRLHERVLVFKRFYIDEEAEKKFKSLHAQTEVLREAISKTAMVEEAEKAAKAEKRKPHAKMEGTIVEAKCPFVDTKAGDTKQQLIAKLHPLQEQKKKMEHQLIATLSQLNTEIINFFIAVYMHFIPQTTEHLQDEVQQSQAAVDDILNILSDTRPPSEVLPINTLRRSLRTYQPSHMVTMPVGKTLDGFLSKLRASLCEDQVRALAQFRQAARQQQQQQQQQDHQRHSTTGNSAGATAEKPIAADFSDISSPSGPTSPSDDTTTHVKTVVVAMPPSSVAARRRSVPEDFFPAPRSPKTLQQLQPPSSPQTPSKDGSGDSQNASILVKGGGPPTTFVLGKRVDHFMQKWCRYYNSNHTMPTAEAGAGESVFSASRKAGALSLNSTGRDSEYWQRAEAEEDLPFGGRHALASFPVLQMGARRITTCYPASGGGGSTQGGGSPTTDVGGAAPDRGAGWLAFLAQWRQSTPAALRPEYFEELPLLWILLDVWDETLLAMPYQPWVQLGWESYNKFLSDVEAPLFASQQYWSNLLADQIDEIEVNIDALEREVSRLGPSQSRGSAPSVVQQVFDRTAELIERLDTGRNGEPGMQALSVLDAKV